jgi:ATPase subunit of ABC transporter with duplicated ATPase domains
MKRSGPRQEDESASALIGQKIAGLDDWRGETSGGERQRLELATHMGEDGGVYVLDEPTTGLHLADLQQLLGCWGYWTGWSIPGSRSS